MKLMRSGVAACVVYVVAIIWLIAKHYSGAQSSTIDAAEFYLVTYPLAILGLNMFGPEEFWAKYQLFLFPACFVVFYLVGGWIGWILGFEKLSDTSSTSDTSENRTPPPDAV
jgi:hypothetical protein